MRRAAYLIALTTWVLTVPATLVHGEQTLQQRYLDVYLKINDAEHLEKQGDYRGALDDFKDCYSKLAKIHDSDPNWESALVTHRMADCQAKIIDLTPKAALQPQAAPPAPPVAGVAPSANGTAPAVGPTPTAPAPDSAEVASLKMQLQAVKEELQITKQKLSESQAQLETYRTQLETVNAQLAALKNQQSVDDRMGKLMSDNKELNDKLAAAQKELETLKTSPKGKLALVQAQLKNVQDQYAASQEANKALQDTTTTLKQQLDQAQADLAAANQKLAAAGTGSPEYDTLKRENEIMRDILTRELQEQAHRDMSKRLAQEEFDRLKLNSKVLQEQLDILGSPMTPPTNDQERALLASLKVPGPDVAPTPTTPNGFSANVSGNQAPTDTNSATATPPATNTATTTPPAMPADNATSTNEPPVNIVMNNPAPTTPDATTNSAPAATPPATPDASTTNTAPAPPATAPATPDAMTATTPAATTNSAPDPSVPVPPTTPAGQTPVPPPPTNVASTPATPPADNQGPQGTTTVTTTTIQQGGGNAQESTPAEDLAHKARLPDDMRETAQDAADLFKNQKYDESAAKYQSIIDKYPESLYAWSNLGVVRFQQGKFDDALKALQQAVKLSPTDAFSYSNLGIVYYQLNQYENAIEALNAAKALDPTDAKTHNYLGCACSQKGWQEVAEKEFRKAIELDPNFGDAHFNLALVYATSKPPSLELARREYNRALELGIAKDARLEKLLGDTASQP